MVLGLFYDALSTAAVIWQQDDEMMIVTDEWEG
jgi:hypothetical protein